jgi:hypothetical protein
MPVATEQGYLVVNNKFCYLPSPFLIRWLALGQVSSKIRVMAENKERVAFLVIKKRTVNEKFGSLFERK